MAPFVPQHTSYGQSKIVLFGGLITTEFLEPPPGRCALMRQHYRHDIEGPIPENLRKLIDSPNRPKGPPVHFHPFQTEYFSVEEGMMGIERNGVITTITPESGEVSAKPGTLHRFFIHPDSKTMTIYISVSDAGLDYQLDRCFFENWYGYWHDALLYGNGVSFLQLLSIWDAGDAYFAAPAWVPFRLTVGYWTQIALGRWLGGMLGYRPFFREYTTDWDYAVAKMKNSFFQRHLANEAYKSEAVWEDQVKLCSGPKPANADFESLTLDIHQEAQAEEIQYLGG
ncbi:hypothetical protein P280DRAFT_534017 [Massarina eburnea CBS 473.64]|uniref:Uncharacterized protein n=1 Tax=Massarina eburnea CBS 473.64 TaxID=1395130 RepID=A0A6A6RLQ5_9PLEO|nr:hypothetical protein P280DRAFT_534017 [Massarina eburnea CBS 473.64]